jgi:hypothetical protein
MVDDKPPIRHGKNLEEEECERMFTHALHEEGVFYNRLNFFLVFESLLFAAAVAGGNEGPPKGVVAFVCLQGLVGSLFWWYAQVNKLVLLKALEQRCVQAFDEFRESLQLADESRIFREWSSNRFLAHAFPVLFLVAWVTCSGTGFCAERKPALLRRHDARRGS